MSLAGAGHSIDGDELVLAAERSRSPQNHTGTGVQIADGKLPVKTQEPVTNPSLDILSNWGGGDFMPVSRF